MTDTKRCSKCGEVKTLDCFYLSKTGSLGRHAYCKECAAAYAKKRHPEVYASTRQTAIERAVRWQTENKERYRERYAAWYAASPTAREKKRDYERLRAAKPSTRSRAQITNLALRERLNDSYIKSVMVANGWFSRHAEVPSELIALKREQLAIKRMARELKKATQGEPK